MSRTIYKYPLHDMYAPKPVDGGGISLPHKARPVAFVLDGRTPMLYAEVDPGASVPKIRRRYKFIVTGVEVPDGYDYVGTAHDSIHVFHLYIEQEKSE